MSVTLMPNFGGRSGGRTSVFAFGCGPIVLSEDAILKGLGNRSSPLNKSLGTQLAVSCDGVVFHWRKAAFPLSHDIEADERIRTTVFLPFEGDDEV
jgi:hypothetical protein